MAGRAVFDESYYVDVRALQQRGFTQARIARELGMSRSSVYRLLDRHGRR